MNQQERFEAFYADQHGVPVESMAKYRMGDSYRLPAIAAHYRTFKAAEDGVNDQEPAWYEHTMRDERGAAINTIIADHQGPAFGKPDVEYDKAFSVSIEPLFKRATLERKS